MPPYDAWDAEDVIAAFAQLALDRPVLLSELTRLVREYSGASCATRYVDLLAGDWLDNYLHVLYAAWSTPHQASAPPPASVIPVFATSTLFFEASTRSVEFHDFVRTAVRGLQQAGTVPATARFGDQAVEHVQNPARPALKRLLGSGGRSAAPVLICEPYFRCGTAEWLLALAKWSGLTRWDDLNQSVRWRTSVDAGWRLRAAAEIGRVRTFRDCALALLPLMMPLDLLEAFATTREQILEARIPRPQVVYTANALIGDTKTKLLLAEWAAQGTRILDHQHGGGYGLDRAHNLEDYEIGVAHRFFTWGWSDPARPSVEPLSPTAPSVRPRGRSGVLLCSVEHPPCIYRLHVHPMPGKPIENMHRQTMAFVDGVADPARLRVRPHPNDFGSPFVSQLRSRAPQVAFDESGGRPYRQFASSALVVHSYLGTSWLETLALDVPTVCFYDASVHAFREAARPYIDQLIDVGILHHSGAAAARFVNGLGGAPERWWRQTAVQQAREAFVMRYARFSGSWQGEWRRAFESALETQS